jgi:hypothetical protein
VLRLSPPTCSSPLPSWMVEQVCAMGHGAYRILYKSGIVHMPYMYKHYVNNNNLMPTIMRVFDFETMDRVLDFASEVRAIVEGLPGGYGNPLIMMNAIAMRSAYQSGTYGGHNKDQLQGGGGGEGKRI